MLQHIGQVKLLVRTSEVSPGHKHWPLEAVGSLGLDPWLKLKNVEYGMNEDVSKI